MARGGKKKKNPIKPSKPARSNDKNDAGTSAAASSSSSKDKKVVEVKLEDIPVLNVKKIIDSPMKEEDNLCFAEIDNQYSYPPRIFSCLNLDPKPCEGCKQTKVLLYACPCLGHFYCTRECWLKSPHGINRWEECGCISVSESNGSEPRKVLTRKNLKPGDPVYAELYPLVRGPSLVLLTPMQNACDAEMNIPDEDRISACLTCCKLLKLKEFVPCRSCGWFFCDIMCSKDPVHREAECKLFSSNKQVIPSFFEELWGTSKSGVTMNRIIYIIRALFLKFTNRDLYKQILTGFDRNADLEEFLLEELAKGIPDYGNEDGFVNRLPLTFNMIFGNAKKLDVLTYEKRNLFRVHVAEFWNIIRILRYYKLCTRFSMEEVAQLLAVLKRNTVEYKSVGSGGTLWGTEGTCLLYEITSAVTYSCIPNAVVRINPSENFSLVCTAVEYILSGSHLRISVNQPLFIMLGTHLRQVNLLHLFGSTCSCSRCSDPSEKGTNLMRLKCSVMLTDNVKRNMHCTEGLLPINPLNPYSDWKCQGENPCCDVTVPFFKMKGVLSSIEYMTIHLELKRVELFSQLHRFLKSNQEITDASFLKIHIDTYHEIAKNITPALGPNHFMWGLLEMHKLMLTSASATLHKHLEPKIPLEVLANRICSISLFVREMYDNVLPQFSLTRNIINLYYTEGAFLCLSLEKLPDEKREVDVELDMKMKQVKKVTSTAGAFVLLSALYTDSQEIEYILRGVLKENKEVDLLCSKFKMLK